MPKFHLHTKPSKKGLLPINMLYSFFGMRLNYSTGISIEERFFNPECNTSKKNPIHRMPKDAHIDFNEQLLKMKLHVQSIVSGTDFDLLSVKYIVEELNKEHNKHRVKKSNVVIESQDFQPTTLIKYFDKLIKDEESGKRLMKSGKQVGARFTKSTIKNHKTTMEAIKRYCNNIGIKDILLVDVDSNFYESFREYVFVEEKKEVSTFSNYIKNIKSFMLESKIKTFDPLEFRKPSYETHAIALTLEQLDRLQELDLGDNPRYDNVRDLFLVGCYTAARYADYNDLEIENIEGGFIRIKQKKTGARVTIPVLKRLQKIIDKNNGKFPRSVSNQELNRIIKEVAKKAQLTQLITVNSTAGNIHSSSEIALYKLISSHTARRSYATIMFKLKVPTILIMSATGHKTESSFMRYIRANQEEMAVLLADNIKELGL